MPDASTPDSDVKPQATSVTSGSGGVNISGSATIGGDLAGRDIIKVTGYTADQVETLLTQIRTTFQPKPFDGRCPYLGLDAFTEDDADRFFGREKLVEELVARVKESRFLIIAGPSGSGKSSMVRAGLIHALKQGALANSDRWLYATLTPGRDPIESLALAMSRMKSPEVGDYLRQHAKEADALHKCVESMLSDRPDQRGVIFVDQFEEIFTQVSREDERAAFLNLLTHAAMLENGRVTVLFALRSDFVSNCATYPQLNALLNQQFLQVGAMQPDELVSAIARPALEVGLRIDPDLVAQIVNDMQDEPGALPLMQFALKDLFDTQQAKGGVIALTLNDYLARGGLRKALERHADVAFSKLNEDEQQLARTIFSGLIEIGRGTQDTRRTAAFHELVPVSVDVAQVKVVVEKLADARLITTDERDHKETVTIAHETLIEAWPWLHKLVNENREVIALQNQITEDAQEWDEHQRDASYLYTGARLATAHEQLMTQKIVLSSLAQKFVAESVATEATVREREEVRRQRELDDARKLAEAEKLRAEEQARSATKLRRRAVYLIGALMIALGLGMAAGVFGVQSNQNADTADRNAATAQAASTLAFANAGTAQAASTQAVIEANVRATAVINANIQRDEAQHQAHVAFSRQLSVQSRTLLNSDLSRSLLLAVEALTVTDTAEARDSLLAAVQHEQRLIRLLHGHAGEVMSIALSPDGQTLVSGSPDGTLMLWDMTNPASPKRLGTPLTGHLNEVLSVAFSPDGKTVASGGCERREQLRCTSGQITLWDVSNRQVPVEASRLSSYPGEVLSVAFDPDGKILASGGCGRYDASHNCVEGQIILWNVSNPILPLPISPPLKGHSSEITSVAFHPDRKTLASENGNGKQPYNLRGIQGQVILWNISSIASPIQLGKPLDGHPFGVSTVAFSPDGKLLASAGGGNFVVLWDVSNLQSPVPVDRLPTGYAGNAPGLAFSSNGKLLAASGRDNGIVVWDVSKPMSATQLDEPLSGHTAPVLSLAFSPDNNTLFSGSWDHSVGVWAVSNSRSPLLLKESPVDVTTSFGRSTALSTNGRLWASAQCQSLCIDCEGEIILTDVSKPDWAVRMNVPLTGYEGCVSSITFSHGGDILASASKDGSLLLWDISNLESPIQLTAPLKDYKSEFIDLTFSPDDKILAGGSTSGDVVLWDVTNPKAPKQIDRLLEGPSPYATAVAFSPDGKTLAFGNINNTVVLWDVTTPYSPTQLSAPMEGHAEKIMSVAFSPDGRILASAAGDGQIILWDISNRRAPVPLGEPLQGPYIGLADKVAFGLDGRGLALVRDTPQGALQLMVWDVNVASWEARACERAGRNLTREEWQWYFGGEPYRKTCEPWPLEPEVTPTPGPTLTP